MFSIFPIYFLLLIIFNLDFTWFESATHIFMMSSSTFALYFPRYFDSRQFKVHISIWERTLLLLFFLLHKILSQMNDFIIFMSVLPPNVQQCFLSFIFNVHLLPYVLSFFELLFLERGVFFDRLSLFLRHFLTKMELSGWLVVPRSKVLDQKLFSLFYLILHYHYKS